MLRGFLAAVLLLSAEGLLFAEDEAAQIIFVSRHAQRGPRAKWSAEDREKPTSGEYLDGKYLRPAGEDSITPLGEKQSALLGAYLKKQYGFNGRVFASPRFWTMQTACGIVSAINPSLKIVPEPLLQGLGKAKTPGKGLTSEELERRFPGRVTHADYPETWRIANENPAMLQERMNTFVRDLLAREKASQILIVGHSSSLPSLIRALNALAVDKKLVIEPTSNRILNCCLFVFRLDKEGKVIGISLETDRVFDDAMKTSNFKRLDLSKKP